jgi:hypothetical protein
MLRVYCTLKNVKKDKKNKTKKYICGKIFFESLLSFFFSRLSAWCGHCRLYFSLLRVLVASLPPPCLALSGYGIIRCPICIVETLFKKKKKRKTGPPSFFFFFFLTSWSDIIQYSGGGSCFICWRIRGWVRHNQRSFLFFFFFFFYTRHNVVPKFLERFKSVMEICKK